ncbi:MAG: hypothetical protein ACOZAL_00665 [Patescibacteria group bacterium]
MYSLKSRLFKLFSAVFSILVIIFMIVFAVFASKSAGIVSSIPNMVVIILAVAGWFFFGLKQFKNFIKEQREFKRPYGCEEARKDIDLFYLEGERIPEKDEILHRALFRHIAKRTIFKKYNISCPECWNYYQEMWRKHRRK